MLNVVLNSSLESSQMCLTDRCSGTQIIPQTLLDLKICDLELDIWPFSQPSVSLTISP